MESSENYTYLDRVADTIGGQLSLEGQSARHLKGNLRGDGFIMIYWADHSYTVDIRDGFRDNYFVYLLHRDKDGTQNPLFSINDEDDLWNTWLLGETIGSPLDSTILYSLDRPSYEALWAEATRIGRFLGNIIREDLMSIPLVADESGRKVPKLKSVEFNAFNSQYLIVRNLGPQFFDKVINQTTNFLPGLTYEGIIAAEGQFEKTLNFAFRFKNKLYTFAPTRTLDEDFVPSRLANKAKGHNHFQVIEGLRDDSGYRPVTWGDSTKLGKLRGNSLKLNVILTIINSIASDNNMPLTSLDLLMNAEEPRPTGSRGAR